MKKYLLLFILALLVSCATKPVMEKPAITTEDPLIKFFIRCRSDLDSARRVIIDQDIVKNLTHLQKMNAGGKKYYLLERENITRMLNAVTRGVYSDYILINAGGAVIYTRENNDIFSKNVRSHLKNGPLEECYNKKAEGAYFSDVRRLNNFEGGYLLFVSGKVSGGESFPGLLVLQVDLARIMELLEPGTAIVGKDGNYRYHPVETMNGMPCEYFTSIDTASSTREKPGSLKLSDGRVISYHGFSYENLDWVFVTEKQP